jgi:polysaccharide export outer membrane protein
LGVRKGGALTYKAIFYLFVQHLIDPQPFNIFHCSFPIMKKLIWYFLIAFSLQSCVSSNKLYLFHDLKPGLQAIEREKQDNNVRIKKGDRLSITVTLLDPAQTAFFNGGATQGGNQLRRYIVRSDGTIDFPLLGRVNLTGLTVRQASDSITQSLRMYYNDPFVIINFEGRVFFISGKNGNVVEMIGERLTVPELLAQVAATSPFDERDRLWLIREENDQRKFVQIDINSKELFNSPFYYLQNNDVLYLRPSKYFSAFSPNSLLGLSLATLGTVSAILLLINNIFK